VEIPPLSRRAKTSLWFSFVFIFAISVVFLLLFNAEKIADWNIPFVSPLISKILPDEQEQTEVVFTRKFSVGKDSEEWRAVRSDHRLIVAAAFTCRKTPLPDRMSRQLFSLLLLDLTPDGGHSFEAGRYRYRDEGQDAKSFGMTPGEQAALAVSDTLARARLTTARIASQNVPYVWTLGVLALVISAFATFFVTMQSRITPPSKQTPRNALKFRRELRLTAGKRDGTTKKSSSPDRGLTIPLPTRGDGTLYNLVAISAIVLSIAGTTLQGMKQFFDPTRALVQNTRTLLQLRQMHHDIALDIKCDEQGFAIYPKVPEVGEKFSRLVGEILPDYVSFTNLEPAGTGRGSK
jgi:hypothetical protein